MKKEEINEIVKYFHIIGKDEFDDMYTCGFTFKAKSYFHKGEEFHLVVCEDDSVYQGGTEADIIGIELKDIEALKIRFESFTGDKLENIDPIWDEIDKEIRIGAENKMNID